MKVQKKKRKLLWNREDKIMNIDQVILGDNQFFGVNHMSQDKGRQTYEQFKDLNEIKRILKYGLSKGVKGVMFSTHPSIYKICDMIRDDDELRENLNIYVNVPYIIKYVSMVTEMGMYNTIKTMLKGKNGKGKAKFLLETGADVVTLNHIGIMERLIDVELTPFYGLNVKAVFLHNALCDLALGYDMKDVIKAFDGYIRKRYHAIPAYGTLNFSAFSRFLDECGLEESLIMTAVNKKGFLMNPSRDEVVKDIEKSNHTVLAMATLASGRVLPEEAYSYIATTSVKNVVVGLSSEKHADETFEIIKKYILEGK